MLIILFTTLHSSYLLLTPSPPQPRHNMQTTDSSNLFQTTAALNKESARSRKLVRAAKVGDPILLPGQSKVLRMRVRGDDCWTAESGWVARRTDLKVSLCGGGCRAVFVLQYTLLIRVHTLSQTGKTRQVFRGHGGPCTCLSFYDTALSPTAARKAKLDVKDENQNQKKLSYRTILFTGSWDRTIKAWDADVSVKGVLRGNTVVLFDNRPSSDFYCFPSPTFFPQPGSSPELYYQLLKLILIFLNHCFVYLYSTF